MRGQTLGAAASVSTEGQASVLLLGPVRVCSGEDLRAPHSAMGRALLATLALGDGKAVADFDLNDRVWGRRAPNSRSGVAVAVHRLRQWLREQLGDSAAIHRSPGGYALSVAGGTDVAHFRSLVSQASQMDAASAVALLGEALECWRGPALADVPGEGLAEVALQLNHERQAATLDYCRLLLRAGQPARAAELLQPWAASDPLNEQVCAVLIEALAGSSRQVEAINIFERTRRLLAEELGVDPGHQLQAGHLRILRQEVPADTPVKAIGSQSLIPSQLPHDAGTFTGRARDLAALEESLAARTPSAASVFTITGTAGIGKPMPGF